MQQTMNGNNLELILQRHIMLFPVGNYSWTYIHITKVIVYLFTNTLKVRNNSKIYFVHLLLLSARISCSSTIVTETSLSSMPSCFLQHSRKLVSDNFTAFVHSPFD
eukprot:m.220577 g.220577  ORF g.220577 m.220577 type:complete len:106 (-) comp13833_c0_seq1:152-469(-)